MSKAPWSTSTPSRRSVLHGAMLLGGTAALGPWLAGCGSGGSSGSGGASQLTFLTNEDNPDTIKVFDEFFSSYGSNHEGVSVEGQYLGDDVTERLTQLVGSGEPPDFIKLDQGDVAEFVAAGLLEPVTDVVSQLGTVPESLRLVQDGEDWIIPSETGYWMQFYRSDVYEELGLQPGVTWDAFLSNLDALETSELSPNLFVTNPASGYLTDVVVNNLWSNDVPIWDFQEGKWVVTLDTDEFRDRVVQTLEFMKSRAARSPESGNYSYSEVNQTYASGTVATIEYQGRTLKYLTENAPDLLDITGVAPQSHNAELRSTAATAGFAIFKKDGRSDVIKEMLLEFLGGDSYLDYLWTVPGHLIPTTKEGLNGEWRQHEFLQSRPDFLQVIDETYDQARSYLRYPDVPADRPNLAGGAATNHGIYSEMAARFIVQGVESDVVIADAAERLRKLADEIS